MSLRPARALVLCAAVAGCNAMTGIDELEKVDCIDCLDATTDGASDGSPDTRGDAADGALVDGGADASPDVSSDVASDGDAPADAIDATGDGPETGKVCKTDPDCDDLDTCTVDKCNKPASALFGNCVSTRTDGDGDGESPTTLGKCGTDCHDGNKDVFSKQTAYFTKPYTTLLGGSSYDYNCSGANEVERPAKYTCTLSGSTCTTTPGWQSGVPACGASGTWVTACVRSGLVGCIPSTTSTVVQGCR